ncbi:MAG: hypothetical protein SCJ94_11880 [Bacillota bacterium]|nr:hypothetical protein [Bacillota bacterium]
MGEVTSKIKAKKRNTLAGGEFGGVNKQLVRLYFMAAVQKEYPECLEALYNDVYMGAFETHKYPDTVFDWHDLRRNEHDVEINSDHEALKTALTDWGIKYHIAEPWVFDIVIDTLRLWYKYQDKPKYLLWHFKELSYYSSEHAKAYRKEEQEYMRQISEEVVFKKDFLVQGWNRFKTSRKNYEELVKAELEQYLNELEAEAYTRDLPRTAEIRKAYHFNWLALYQVKGLSVSDITIMNQLNSEKTHESTVRKAIKKTATWVDLELRKE